MNKRELRKLLALFEITPSKKLGQNFLLDTNMRDALIRAADPSPGEHILEIGPGAGTLSVAFLDKGCSVTAVEIDRRLGELLQNRFSSYNKFSLFCMDACSPELHSLLPAPPYRCVSNLPYAAATAIIINLVKAPTPPEELFLMLQSEVANHILASPGCKEYGSLTILIQLSYETAFLRNVPPETFWPEPRVASAFIHLRRLPEAQQIDPELKRRVEEIAKLGFNHRRKTFRSQLKPRFPPEAIADAFETLGLHENVRAESVSVPQYIELAKLLTGKEQR